MRFSTEQTTAENIIAKIRLISSLDGIEEGLSIFSIIKGENNNDWKISICTLREANTLNLRNGQIVSTTDLCETFPFDITIFS